MSAFAFFAKQSFNNSLPAAKEKRTALPRSAVLPAPLLNLVEAAAVGIEWVVGFFGGLVSD
jgi:hypothetical protein